MPVLFMGHGSPMNAIEENEFVTGWRNMVNNYQTQCDYMCLGTLGNKRNSCNCNGESP